MSIRYQTLLGEISGELSNLNIHDLNVVNAFIKNLIIPDGAEKGRVLTSDDQGLGKWEMIPEVVLNGDAVGAPASNVVNTLANGTIQAADIVLLDAPQTVSNKELTDVSNLHVVGRTDVGELHAEHTSALSLTAGALQVNGVTQVGELYATDTNVTTLQSDSVTTNSLQLTTGAGNGKILKSDGNGQASWQLPVVNMSGDVTGSSSAAVVSRINGTAVAGASTAATANNLVLRDANGAVRFTGTSVSEGILWFNNNGNNQMINLFGATGANQTEFFGFGINSATLRYNVPLNNNHRFYEGTNLRCTINSGGVNTPAVTTTATTTTSLATSTLKVSTGAAASKVLTSDASGNATWQDPVTSVTMGGDVTSNSGTSLVSKINGTAVAGASTAATANTLALRDASGGSAFNNLSTSALTMATGAGVSKVLTSDAAGNATWQSPASTTSVTMGGDISGNSGSAIISKINGTPIAGANFLDSPNTLVQRNANGACEIKDFVSSSIYTDALRIATNSGAGLGKVLTSDSIGRATWQPLTLTGDIAYSSSLTSRATVNSINGTAVAGASVAATGNNVALRDPAGNCSFSGLTVTGQNQVTSNVFYASNTYTAPTSTSTNNTMQVFQINGVCTLTMDVVSDGAGLNYNAQYVIPAAYTTTSGWRRLTPRSLVTWDGVNAYNNSGMNGTAATPWFAFDINMTDAISRIRIVRISGSVAAQVNISYRITNRGSTFSTTASALATDTTVPSMYNDGTSAFTGLSFPNGGNSLLNYYEEYSMTTVYGGAWSNSGTANIKIIRIGKQVTITQLNTVTGKSVGTPATGLTVVPARFYNAGGESILGCARGLGGSDGRSNMWLSLSVGTSGGQAGYIFLIVPDGSFDAGKWGTNNPATIFPWTITYCVP